MNNNLPSGARSGVFLRRTVLGAVFAVAAGTSAMATTLPPFSFDPTGGGLTGTPAGPFTANTFNVSDYATVTLTPIVGGAAFTESGFLPITVFQNNGTVIGANGLNSTYGLYFQFTAAGTQNTVGLTPTTKGTFTSLNYTLYGYDGPAATFTPTSTTATGQIALADGKLIDGSVGTTPSPVTPTAAIDVTVNPLVAGFFASPTPFYTELFANFTNTAGEFTVTPTGFTISQGGGTGNFVAAVPEPGSLAVLGTGLLGFGLLSRRRRRD